MAPLRALPLLLASLTLPCVAHADDAAIIEKARVLFDAGVHAREAGDCTTAVRLFQESLSAYRSESLGALINIALCERMLGQTAASYLHYGEFLRGVKERDERIAEAADAMATMMKNGPWVRIMGIDALPANATILLDGVSLGPITKDVDFPAESGDHVIVIEVPKQRDRRVPVFVAKGERHDVDLRPRQTTDPSPPKRPLRPVGFVIGGLGLASIVMGAITGGVAMSKANELGTSCPNPQKCAAFERDKFNELKSNGITMANASTTTFIIGGALTAVGATLILLPPSKTKDVAFAPLVLPGGGGLSCTARF